MGYTMRVILSTVAVAMAIAVFWVDPHRDNAGPAWFWRGGAQDGFRKLCFKPGGQLRAGVKPFLLIWFAAFVWLVWHLP